MANRFALAVVSWCLQVVSCGNLGDDLSAYIQAHVTDSRKIDRFLDIGKCLLQITAHYAMGDENQDLVVLFRKPSNDDAFLFMTEYPIVIITEERNPEKGRYVRNLETAYIFNTRPISDVLNSISWDSKTKFIVVCTSIEEATAVFTQFWEERCVNVVALVYDKPHSHIHLLTYFPYTENHCREVGPLFLLTTWNHTSGIRTNLFPPKLTDMHGCPFYATLLERPPSVMDTPDGIVGVEVDILNHVSRSMNATPIIELLHKKNTTANGRGNILMQELIENLSDAVAGSLMFTTSVSLISDGIDYFESLCVTLAVPKIKWPGHFMFTTIFSERFFLSVATVIPVCVLTFYFILKLKETATTIMNAAWMLLSPLIGGPRLVLNRLVTRSFFAMWLFTSFILCRVFEASVSSSVMAPKLIEQMETMQDVIQSDLGIGGESFHMAEILPRYLSYQARALRRSLLVPPEAFRAVGEGKIAFLGSRMFILNSMEAIPDVINDIHVPEKCVTNFQPVIQIRKKSPFTEILTKHIRALTELGVPRILFQWHVKKSFKAQPKRIDRTYSPLTTNKLRGAFIVLNFGLVMSFILFLVEVCWVKTIKKIHFS